MDLAGIVVASLSALGTLVQAFYTAKGRNVAESKIKSAQKRASEPLKIGVKKVNDVIDERLLATLCFELERHNTNLIDAFRSTDITQADTQVKVTEARAQICKVLATIMSFNEGSLPTKRLEKLWASNRCKAS